LAVNLGYVFWKQRSQEVDRESFAFNPRMKAVETGGESSINDRGEGKWIQLTAETVDGSSADGFGLKPILFLKDLRSHHGEEIASMMHNAFLLNHAGNDAEDAAIIRKW
jgi:hypothetical protein